ncbi:MAG: hypothetical protein QME90_14605 [Thermodesulfobacteriota bacterium]|nr:hypothetical protein [Thermodesulfobacteriota bacterium]
MIKNLSDTKLSVRKTILLGILSGIGGYILALMVSLTQDSNVYTRLKEAKPIDKLLATLTASVSIPLYILAPIFAALLILLYLYYHHRKAVKLQIKEMAEEYYKMLNPK